MIRTSVLLLLAIVGVMGSVRAQKNLHVKKARGKITIDAKMMETDWENAEIASGFNQYFPSDSVMAHAGTEVRMTYDDENVYILAKMHNLGERSYVTPSLRRDLGAKQTMCLPLCWTLMPIKTMPFCLE